MSVSWDAVRARRLERSSLLPRAPRERLVDVVRAVGGVHAQVQASAELQLASRIDGLTRADVREALWERRELAKAWTIRGTLHLHDADELALWLAARRAVSGPRGEIAEWRDPNGVVHPPIKAREAEAVREAVWDVLDGRCLLREQLVEEVVRQAGPRSRERLRSGFAFFLGELCQGPPQGAKITLARPDQWIAGWRDVDPGNALHEVAMRFLRAYGPARPAAFKEWFGAPSFGVEVEELDVGGRTSFVLPGDKRFPPLRESVRLLPEYDVYVMGFRERDELVPEPVRALVAAHGRGRYEGPAGVRFVVVDGVAAGVWGRTKRGKRVELRVTPARRLTRAQRAALGDEAERIGSFLGLEPSLIE
jgi:hypothetical protein